jgi:hypothetical protein
MIRARILGAAVALGLFTGSAMPPRAGETITIRQRFNYMICTGYCTDSDLTVRSDGVAELRVRMIHRAWKHYRYRVTPQQFAGFRAALAAIRPVGTRGPTGDCANREYTAGLNAYEIRWQGGGPDGVLLSCIGEDAGSAYYHAYLALRIAPATGVRMDEEQARDFESRIR